jgi:rod shape-determining protein MreD
VTSSKKLTPQSRQLLNGVIIVASVLLCVLLSPARLPGMELLGIGPNWLLIWVVIWSLKRKALAAILAGVILGLLQDGLSSPNPSHVVVYALVGWLTSLLYQHRYVKEDPITVVLMVFLMSLWGDLLIAAQYLGQGFISLETLQENYQKISLATAVLSSLWAPVLYYPLSCWWDKMK